MVEFIHFVTCIYKTIAIVFTRRILKESIFANLVSYGSREGAKTGTVLGSPKTRLGNTVLGDAKMYNSNTNSANSLEALRSPAA